MVMACCEQCGQVKDHLYVRDATLTRAMAPVRRETTYQNPHCPGRCVVHIRKQGEQDQHANGRDYLQHAQHKLEPPQPCDVDLGSAVKRCVIAVSMR